jgi:hypothetical protein
MKTGIKVLIVIAIIGFLSPLLVPVFAFMMAAAAFCLQIVAVVIVLALLAWILGWTINFSRQEFRKRFPKE